MLLKVKDKEVDVKYTFNSFKYMNDFDLSVLNELESKPFKLIQMSEVLLLGALNSDPKVKYTEKDVSEFLEEFITENSLVELLEDLMNMLEQSNFFKSLQKTPTKKRK